MRHAVRWISFVLVSLWPLALLAASDPCIDALPKSLKAALSERYKAHKLVTFEMLSRSDKRYYRKDHPRKCPGVAVLDFYGTGKKVYAVLLVAGKGPKRTHQLMIAEPMQDDWKVTPLDHADGGSPVIWSEGPGKYEGVSGSETLVAEHPVVVFVGYESWAVVYAWIGSQVKKVWVSD